MKIVGLIPARLESERLPGKPLIEINGIPMIIHVYKRCLLANKLDDVYVVTDSSEISNVVKEYGGKVIMTSSSHQTGTDRIAEAAENIDCDIVVNIQGDEALVDPLHINKIVTGLVESKECQVGILVTPFTKYNSPSDIKVVVNEKSEVMYLSRTDIPSSARTQNPQMLKAYHVVPFRKQFLMKYATWAKTELEKIEYNEYLRILEKGYKIVTVEVDSSAVSVDTEMDLEFVRNEMIDDIYYKRYAH